MVPSRFGSWVALVAALLGLPSWSAGETPLPIHPGARIAPSEVDLVGGHCTLGFLFRDAGGATYAGTAGHCTGGVGSLMWAAGAGAFATVVFREFEMRTDGGALPWTGVHDIPPERLNDTARDFSLLRVHDEKAALADPAMATWGGPGGVATGLAPGTPVLLHGHCHDFCGQAATRGRAGIYEKTFAGDSLFNGEHLDGWYLATAPVFDGDSGGPIITRDGRALGFVSADATGFGEPGRVTGPTVGLALERLAEAGFALELATAPFPAP